eukprot:1159137-Pelagomonas_calceolata.AAC.2
MSFGKVRRKSKVDEARDILANVVVCHVPVVRYNFQQKQAVLVVWSGLTRSGAHEKSGVAWFALSKMLQT